MGLIQGLCLFAVEQFPGSEVGGESARRLLAALQNHLSDQSRKLPLALQRACRNAWKALELALAGDSLGERLRSLLASGDRRAFAEQVRLFLKSCPPPEGEANESTFRQSCLRELGLADRRGLLDGPLDADALARRVGEFSRFSSPTDLLHARRQATDEIAAGLREAGLMNLARLVGFQPAERPSLLVQGVQFFFRREVESNQELARGLTFSQLEGLSQVQQAGFAALAELLSCQGENLERLLGDLHALSAQTHAEVLDIHAELRQQGGQMEQLYQAVLELRERLKVSEQKVLPQTCQTVSNEGDLRRIRDVKTRYWSLREDQRRHAPALGNAVGALSMAAGDYPDAQKAFMEAADTAVDGQSQAVAHLNAYQAALQQGHWDEALAHLRKAVSRGGRTVAPFPVDRYRPERILGAGGFGVAFLCKHTRTEAQVVVKAIQGEQFERDMGVVFREATALEQLEHPAIIRVRDCDFTDPEAQSRPYLVMDYFEGLTLAEQVRRHGPLPLPEFLEVAGLVASALAAAHARGILHRDVKPANVLLRKQGERWQVKLIDFGLAFRLRSVQETVHRPQSMQNTLLGQSIAGTIDYAAPEQMGKLPGVSVSQASDVYGFGKTCCYALFGTPNPSRKHWKQLEDETLCDLLDACLSEQPKDRPATFEQVLAYLPGGTSIRPDLDEARQEQVKRFESDQVRHNDLVRRDLVARIIEGVILHRQAEARFAQEQTVGCEAVEAKVARKPAQAPSAMASSSPALGSPLKTEQKEAPAFRFRSGRYAHSLDEFVALCGDVSEDAAWHLADGHFEPWLRELGRDDLASEAEKARLQNDWTPETKLVVFLSKCGRRGGDIAQRLQMSGRTQPSPRRSVQAPAKPNNDRKSAQQSHVEQGVWQIIGGVIGFVLLWIFGNSLPPASVTFFGLGCVMAIGNGIRMLSR